MKTLAIISLLLIGINVFPQGYGDTEEANKEPAVEENNFGKYENGILQLKDGNRYKIGDTLKLGYGTGPRKDFEFVYVSPANWANVLSGKAEKERLGSEWANGTLIIKDVKNYGRKKTGYKWYLILGGGNIVNYWCEIREALDNKEVLSYITIKSDKVGVASSNADEIKKLKDLLDNGAITQSEYDEAKKRILNKY